MKKIIEPGTWLFPVPAIMVSCRQEGKKPNIITLAWCGVVASEPPMVSIGVRPGRYSHDMILKGGDFVVNLPSKKELWATDFCGNISGRKVDKFKAAGLTPAKASRVSSPIIKECPVNLECKVVGSLRFGTHTHILGEIVAIQCDSKVLDKNGKLDVDKLAPFAFFPSANQYYSMGKALGKHGFSKRGK
jgi:flavin reductase (DIM6/NTAB) family NADH-FMN oxidoreductase RutF